MTHLKALVVTVAFALLSQTNAHGVVTQITANGKQYPGYQPSMGQSPPSDVVGWSIPQDTDLGPIEPPKYNNPDIICHVGATPAKASVTITAGSSLTLKWSSWPDSHHGPVIDYLAPCPDGGDCTSVDKSQLKFQKIAESGLLDGSSPPGYWGADKLREADASWTVKIPECVKPGNYVLRHEIIALHGAFQKDKAQNYPQCLNLKVESGGGMEGLEGGVGAVGMYGDSDPGILVGIYNALSGYQVPGPKVWGCGTGGGGVSGGNGTMMGNRGMGGNGTAKCRQRRARRAQLI